MSESEYNLAILISGKGSTARAVIEACRDGVLVNKFNPVVVVSSNQVAGVEVRKLNIEPVHVARKLGRKSEHQYDEELLSVLRDHRVDIVMQLGHRAKTPAKTVDAFKGRIGNQHPGSLAPGWSADFGGDGMIGQRVVGAHILFDWVALYPLGHIESTVHHVVFKYDDGDLIRVVPMALPKAPKDRTIAEWAADTHDLVDATDAVQKQLLCIEHINVVAALDDYGQHGAFPRWKRMAPLISPADEHMLHEAKQLAFQLFPDG